MLPSATARRRATALSRTTLVALGGFLVLFGLLSGIVGLAGAGSLLPGVSGSVFWAIVAGSVGISLAAAGATIPGSAPGPFVAEPPLTTDQRRYALAGAVLVNAVYHAYSPLSLLVGWTHVVPYIWVGTFTALASMLVGLGVVLASLGPAIAGRRWSDRLPVADGSGDSRGPSLPVRRLELSVAGRSLAGGAGLVVLVFGLLTISAAQSTPLDGSDTGGGAMGIALAMALGGLLVVLGSGLVVVALAVRGPGQRLLGDVPTSEYRLVVTGAILMAVGTPLGIPLLFVVGPQLAWSPAVLGGHLLVVGALVRTGTVVHHRVTSSGAGDADRPDDPHS